MSKSRKDSTVRKSNVMRNSVLAGSMAGMASSIVCYPFELLRIKIQTQALETGSAGIVGTFRQTIQNGGFRALYTGLSLPLGAQAFYKATVFTVNNLTEKAIIERGTKTKLKRGSPDTYELTVADRFFSGFVGGFINSALFVTPVEYVRNQQIYNKRGSRRIGPIVVIKRTLRSDGIFGFWRGMPGALLRDSVGCGCFFVAMSSSQEFLSPNNDQPSAMVIAASGALAGLSFWVWSLPIDTMKTWIQNGSAKNLRHAFQLAFKEGFVKGLYILSRGWPVAYGRGAPAAVITVSTYSFAYKFLTDRE